MSPGGPAGDAQANRDTGTPDASPVDSAFPDSALPCDGMMCSSLSGPCGTGICDEATDTCVVQMVDNGTACTDDDPCTIGDACMDGMCVSSGAVDCSALDDACAAGTCDPATGMCQATPVVDGTICDDTDPCTEMDQCAGGGCAGAPLDCSAMTDMCNVGTCDAMSGTCGVTPVMDGISCDDGNPDTMDDQCTAGVCRGTGACRWLLVSEGSQLAHAAIGTLLTTAGFDFFVQPNNGSTGTYTSDAAYLGAYTHMIFHHTNRAITAAENTALSAWLGAGGRMIATGYDTMGSPTDASFAALMGCSSPADGPFTSTLSVVAPTHAIMMGPFQTFTAATMLTASTTDHDRCTPTSDATRLVSMSSGTTSSKLQIRTGVGAGRGMSVYWNGNGSLRGDVTDWTATGGGTQPALQNLLLNTMRHLCDAP